MQQYSSIMLLYCYFTAASKSSCYWLEAKSCNAVGLVNALHTNVAVRWMSSVYILCACANLCACVCVGHSEEWDTGASTAVQKAVVCTSKASKLGMPEDLTRRRPDFLCADMCTTVSSTFHTHKERKWKKGFVDVPPLQYRSVLYRKRSIEV